MRLYNAPDPDFHVKHGDFFYSGHTAYQKGQPHTFHFSRPISEAHPESVFWKGPGIMVERGRPSIQEDAQALRRIQNEFRVDNGLASDESAEERKVAGTNVQTVYDRAALQRLANAGSSKNPSDWIGLDPYHES
jgi:hypothetical protein